MKPSKDLDEQIEELLTVLAYKSALSAHSPGYTKLKFSHNEKHIAEAKQQLLALIEQREREARIKEAKFIYENYFDGEEFHPNELVERIAELKKGER